MTTDMSVPIEPIKRGRGRPPVDGAGKTSAQRQAAHRDRLRAVGVESLTVKLDVELLAALSKFVQFKDESKSEVVARILRGALLRKR